MIIRRLPLLFVCILAASLLGCREEKSPPARKQVDISTEQRSLDALFLTEKSHRKVIVPQNTRELTDPETGEVIWPAMVCNNPNCPGKDKGADGLPFLFICTDPSKPMYCPECLTVRDLGSETNEEMGRYIGWVTPYRLPETAARIQELDAERKRGIVADEALQKRRNRKLHE
jgi:hypothetical protein